MDQPILSAAMDALKKNKFGVHLATAPARACDIIINEIIPKNTPLTVSFGDSMTLKATGALDRLRGADSVEFIDTFEKGVERAEIMARRRRALHADYFLTGTNALTTAGQLVNLDMIGNRVGGLVFGPENVVVVVGENKIVEGLEAAMERVKTVAAPKNAARHGCKTPCAKTGKCMDCKSPERICNVWTITEKSWPAGRIQIVLVRGEHGL